MSETNEWQKELYSGLQALADSSFPKKCNNCGAVYETAEEFIRHTKKLQPQTSGLKQSYDDDDEVIVELYRNCTCGSTLLDFFTDRRDVSPQGLERRERFSMLLDKLVTSGLSEVIARVELIKVLRGPVLQEINTIVAKRGIRLLGVYNVGVRHIMSKKPVKNIADLEGLKIRTMQSKYHMAAFNAFGANATPISYAELYSSLQTGVVDGAEAANTNYFEKKFYEVAPYWGQLGWTILTAPIIMSEKST